MMLHQPSGGSRGVAADIEIQAREILLMRERLNKVLAEHTGQSVERIAEDTERDFWMNPEEARNYGLIDQGPGAAQARGQGRQRLSTGAAASPQSLGFRPLSGACNIRMNHAR
jgi:hypothetical protein